MIARILGISDPLLYNSKLKLKYFILGVNTYVLKLREKLHFVNIKKSLNGKINFF